MEVTDDEVSTHLLIIIKFIVIVEDPGSPIKNKPYYKSRVLRETKVENPQHKTEATIDHYLQEGNAYSGLSNNLT